MLLVGLFRTMLDLKKWHPIFKLWKHFRSNFLWSCLEDPVIISELRCISYSTNISAQYFIHLSAHPGALVSALSVNEVSLFQMSRVLHLSHPVKMELAYQYPPGATRSSTAPMPRMKRTAVRHRCPCCNQHTFSLSYCNNRCLDVSDYYRLQM